MIEYINDLMFSTEDFANNYDYLVNTVNCSGAMGAGVAYQFRQLYPELYQWYRLLCQQNQFRPGCVRVWNEKIICIATKDHWKYPSKMEWVHRGLVGMRNYLELTGRQDLKVAMPLPGAGKGKLSPFDVAGLIDTTLSNYDAAARGVDYHVYVGQFLMAQ